MPSVGAVTSNLNVKTQTANYTAVANDLVLANAASGAITVTMPTAPVLNTVVAVKKTDSSANVVNIVPGGTSNLNGDTSAQLVVGGAAATFQYDGTNWQLLSTSSVNTSSVGLTNFADMIYAPTYTAGVWYDRRTGVCPTAASSNIAMSTTTIYYAPVFAFRALNIDRLGYSVGSTAPSSGAVIRLGLYSASATTGLPATLLYDWGTLSLGSTASVMLQLAAAGTLPRGWSYFAISYNQTTPGSAVSMAAGFGSINPLLLGVPESTGLTSATSVASGAAYLQQAGSTTAAALASPAAVTASYGTQASFMPNLWYRAV